MWIRASLKQPFFSYGHSWLLAGAIGNAKFALLLMVAHRAVVPHNILVVCVVKFRNQLSVASPTFRPRTLVNLQATRIGSRTALPGAPADNFRPASRRRDKGLRAPPKIFCLAVLVAQPR